MSPQKKDTFIYASTSLTNTCDKPLLLWGQSTAPSQMCQRYRRNCDVDYSNCLCLPVCLSGCLAVSLPVWCPLLQCPLTPETCPTFQTCLASLPSFHFFHSFPKPVSLLGRLYLGQRCAVNGVRTRLRTDPRTPVDILPTPFGTSISKVTFSHPLCHFSAWLVFHLWISMAG